MRCDTVDVGEVVPRDANARIGGDVPHANRGVPASGQEQERHLVVPRKGPHVARVAAERAVYLDRNWQVAAAGIHFKLRLAQVLANMPNSDRLVVAPRGKEAFYKRRPRCVEDALRVP